MLLLYYFSLFTMQSNANIFYLPSLSWWESSAGRCEAERLIYQPTTYIWLSWSCYTIAEKKDKKKTFLETQQTHFWGETTKIIWSCRHQGSQGQPTSIPQSRQSTRKLFSTRFFSNRFILLSNPWTPALMDYFKQILMPTHLCVYWYLARAQLPHPAE